jgi:hypothetical protein
MLLGQNATISGMRHRKTGTADQSTPTQTMFSGEPASIQPVRGDNPVAFNTDAPSGALYFIFTRLLSVPTTVCDGDVLTDDQSRQFTVLGIEEHKGPRPHLKITARTDRKLTRVAA